MTDNEINDIVTGNWTPGQIASFERAHPPVTHRADENGFCTCGGQYIWADTMQGTHPIENWWQQDTYQCSKCKTWMLVIFDAHGVEYERRYEAGQ